jgi:hypothetical protein
MSPVEAELSQENEKILSGRAVDRYRPIDAGLFTSVFCGAAVLRLMSALESGSLTTRSRLY